MYNETSSNVVYHITPNGMIKECEAKKGNCPFKDENGNPAEHYISKEDAQIAYASKMEEFETPKTMSQNGYTRVARRYINSNPLLKQYGSDFLRRKETPYPIENCLRTANEYYALSRTAFLNDRLDESAAYYKLYKLAESISKTEMNGGDERLNEWKLRRFKRIVDEPIQIPSCFPKAAMLEDNRNLNLQQRVKSSDGKEHLFSEAVLGYDSDGKKIRLSDKTQKQIKAEISDTAEKFVKIFKDKKGKFSFPESYSDFKKNGFEFLGGGSEGNAYLHKETMMVYKIPHIDNPIIESFRNPARSSLIINQIAKEVLNDADKNSLKELRVKYLPTAFLDVSVSPRKKIGITVQPYLNTNRFRGYTLSRDVEDILNFSGFTDLHDGNVHYDSATRTIYMNDCLTWGESKVEKARSMTN